MNTKLTWRFVLIAILLALCLLEVIPPQKKLKPGIDLAGGTSLLYQIDASGLETWEKRNLSQTMIHILRQRIDPANNRNLIWRAQGNDRIEIQMPLATEETRQKHQNYQDKLQALLAENIDLRQVRRALGRPEQIDQAEYQAQRAEAFAELADGSEQRLASLTHLGETYDKLGQAKSQLVTALTAETQLRSQMEQAQIDQTAVDNMLADWGDLDEPNRAVRIDALADQVPALDASQNRAMLEQYIKARRQLSADRTARRDSQADFDAAWSQLEELNINADRLEQVLASLAEARTRSAAQQQIDLLKEQHPARAEGLTALTAVYLDYAAVAGRLDDPEDLKRLLQGSGVLEFRILPRLSEGDPSSADIQRYRELLAKYGPTSKSGDENYVWTKIKSPEDFPVGELIVDQFAGQLYVLAANGPAYTLLHESGPDAWRLRKARVGNDNLGKWAVDFSFNPIGAGRFWDLTKSNIDRILAILLDDEIISAPGIRSAIGERGQITGQFSMQEVQDLVDMLNAGSLPARLGDEPISIYSIGPTLGAENLTAGLRAGIIGLITVAGFMLIYYLVSGALAGVALFMNLLIILAVMAFSRSTFTMAGIAGLILTIGMAVDANVLIFERIREELARGSSLRMAIKNGYDRALRTILDANITTFGIALILWMVAPEEIKGFALTLMIGIVSSMFTALFVTRTIFDFLTGRRIIKNKLPMLQIIGRPQVNWMGARVILLVISLLLVIGGWAIFLGRDEQKNSKYSIEFTGGTSIHVALTEAAGDIGRAEVQERITAVGAEIGNKEIQAALVQQVGDPEKKEFEIVTTATNLVEVRITTDPASNVTADQIRLAVQKAANDFGDNRLGNATVSPTDAPAVFNLVTNQANINNIHQTLGKALRQLSAMSFKVQADSQVLISVPADAKLTSEQISQAINAAGRTFGVGDDTQLPALNPAGPAGQFTLDCRLWNKNTIPRALDQALMSLSGLSYDIGKTRAIVNDSARKAMEGLLEVQDDLEATNITGVPITEELISSKPYLQEHLGGVLLTADFGNGKTETMARLAKRFEQSRFKAEFDQYGRSKLVLFAANDAKVAPDQPLSSIEVVAVSPEFIYQPDQPEEFASFQSNESDRVGAILGWATSLARVNQIDPSVGHKSMNQAMVAIVLSLLAMIIYIWFRFGNVRFGVAAAIALVHDVSIALGLVAASAWLSTTALGRALLISDFKIDPPMIAAFLTVIGYSLNDTIVVFDRIRENRGKLATLSPDIINTSINQTVSRTILTSFTTMLVLVIMYIWGGETLRGFNYVLIIGVLVGTYSSIGIAAPLLYGAHAVADRVAAKNSK